MKKIYSTAAYNNLDVYQVNCTYYSALGNRDQAYLLSRAIQFFAPGIPMVYYVGLLAGENDVKLMERTKNGRDINRRYYTREEVERQLERKVVRDLRDLMEFRNQCPAFDLNGTCETAAEGSRLEIVRKYQGHRAVLKADLKTFEFVLEAGGE